jgi:hypothetical protein
MCRFEGEYPTHNGEKLIVPFGPAFPCLLNAPNLLPAMQTDVVSFGKDYVLRFPSSAEGWSGSEPSANVLCILKTREGCYLRVNFAPRAGEFVPCYIDISTGLIHANTGGLQHRFTRPTGEAVIAVEWELVTMEPKPRLIFAQRSARGELNDVP